jgi:hypothetical protein
MTTLHRLSNRPAALHCVLGLLALGLASAVSAAPTGPVFPPPGGATFVANGAINAGLAPGRNFNYSAFNPASFSELYWGVRSDNLPTAGLDGALHAMTFAGQSGNQAWWDVTSNWTNPTTLVTSAETIRLMITITGLGANPWIDGTSVGLPSSIGWVVDNSLGQNFTANMLFFVPTEGNTALNSMLQLPSCSGQPCAKLNFASGFYYVDPESVPEPGTLALAGLGLLGFAMTRRRRADA